MDKKLNQIIIVHKLFAGLLIIMLRDPGQLLPAGANSSQVNICKKDNLSGFILCKKFEDTMILAENNRLN